MKFKNKYLFIFLFIFFFGGGGGCQGGCERRSEALVKIQKKWRGGGFGRGGEDEK